MSRLDELLTVSEAAGFLGVAPNTIRNWDRDGKIPVFRHPLNHYRMFKQADLLELLRQIEKSGEYPTGWPRQGKRSRKPR